MTAKEGRKRSVRVLVAVGNGRGAAGEWGCDHIRRAGGGGTAVAWAQPWSQWVQAFLTNQIFQRLGLTNLVVNPYNPLESKEGSSYICLFP